MTCFAHVECSHPRCFHQAAEYVELDLGGLDYGYINSGVSAARKCDVEVRRTGKVREA